jgi:hypothetical protein
MACECSASGHNGVFYLDAVIESSSQAKTSVRNASFGIQSSWIASPSVLYFALNV